MASGILSRKSANSCFENRQCMNIRILCLAKTSNLIDETQQYRPLYFKKTFADIYIISLGLVSTQGCSL